jgi:hypothetical protein
MSTGKGDGVPLAGNTPIDYWKAICSDSPEFIALSGFPQPFDLERLRALIGSGRRGLLGVWAMATEPPPRTLMGPPVSRRKQRALGIAHFRPGLGYAKRNCSRCGRHTWIGPKQLEVLEAEPTTAVICLGCLQPELAEGLVTGKIALTHLGGRGGSYFQANGKYFGPPEEFQN